MFEQNLSVLVKPCAADELQRVLLAEESLRAFLVFVAFAQNLVGVGMKSCVGSPRTITHVIVDIVPFAPIVYGIMCLSPALGPIAIGVPSPYQVIATWLEAKDLGMESIG